MTGWSDSSRRARAVVSAATLLVTAGTVASCGGSHTPQVIEVAAGSSIQKAVDGARSGDLVLVQPGIYHESVVIDHDGVTLRGVDRNTVVLDGQDKLEDGVMVLADGVTVENLTVHHYSANGVVVTGARDDNDESQLTGFRMAYLTAYDNGLYGLYSFQAVNGTISDSYVSGHADSGVYVGQCGNPFRAPGSKDTVAGDASPCNVVVQRVTAEFNAVGYEGTNASQVWLVDSVIRNNRVGVTPNSQSLEKRPPSTDAVIAGNLVMDNNAVDAPEQESGGFGLGIAVGSGVGNLITKNRVQGNAGAGILVTTLDRFIPSGNRVEGNVVTGNKLDLGYWQTGGQTPTESNCFSDNKFSSSSPPGIERLLPCPGTPSSVTAPVMALPTGPAGPRPSEVRAPPAQATMPGDVRAFAPPPTFTEPDLASITVPPAP